jgi:hypothetical protein
MSLTARVLLIVFGSLAAISIAAVSWFAYFSYRMFSTAADPATIKRVSAEFGTFDVPPGYRVTMAMDAIVSTLILSRDRPPAEGDRFAISLFKGRPATPGVAVSRVAMERRISLMTSMPLKIPRCTQLATAKQEPVESKAGTIVLRSTFCKDAGHDTEMASAYFSVKSGFVFASAIGPREDFDLPTMRKLLASFR